MSFFVSVGIIILAMLIMIFLQLSPGVFTLFYHYALGKYSRKRVSDLGIFFILGVETTSACVFLSSFYISYLLFFHDIHPESGLFAWIAVGILVVLAAASFFFYYRRGSGTQLFIPRRAAHSIDSAARSVKTRSDAFILGAFSNIHELVFALPLYIITSVEIMEMRAEFITGNILTILYILTPTLSLFTIRWLYHSGHNLADIERSRVKNKSFTRFILAFSYLTIAILIIYYRIIPT